MIYTVKTPTFLIKEEINTIMKRSGAEKLSTYDNAPNEYLWWSPDQKINSGRDHIAWADGPYSGSDRKAPISFEQFLEELKNVVKDLPVEFTVKIVPGVNGGHRVYVNDSLYREGNIDSIRFSRLVKFLNK